MRLDNNRRAFIALVKAGLRGQEVHSRYSKNIDFKEIGRLAQEESMVGVVAAGIEYVSAGKRNDLVVIRDLILRL